MEALVKRIAAKHLQNVKDATEDNLRARCPFHDSKSSSRSLALNKKTGLWLCFSCGERGSLITLLRRLKVHTRIIDNVAKKMESQRQLSPLVRRKLELNTRPKTVVLPEYILAAWHTCPERLLDEGFDMDVLDDHEVGYDSVRDRITFPIRDHLGRLVAVSGRAYEDGVNPRYKVYDARPPDPQKNLSAGELYGIVEDYKPANRRHLYGFHMVYPRRFFARGNLPPILIVEGYKGRIWVHQCGYEDVVAVQGSSISSFQAITLTRVRGPYYVMLDNEPGKAYPDDKGRCASLKIADRLSRSGSVRICQYTEDKAVGTSPDDLSPDEIDHMVDNARTRAELIIQWIGEGTWVASEASDRPRRRRAMPHRQGTASTPGQ